MKQLAKFLIVGALPWAIAMAVTSQGTTLPGAAPPPFGCRGGNDGGLDRQLRNKLAQAGFTGDIERIYKKRLKQSLGRPIDPQARRARPPALVRQHSFARPRQHLRRLPLADERHGRLAADGHRRAEQQRRRPASHRSAQSAPHADGGQHGALPAADVEQPVRIALGRSVRSARTGFSFPAPEGDTRFSPPRTIATT